MTQSTVQPLDVGRKFHANGKVRTFPGSTIIGHVAGQADLVARLDRLYECLRGVSAAASYTLLPPSSWHMTLFVGICDQDRRSDRWPAELALDAPLDDVTEIIGARLRAEPFGIRQRFRMRVDHFAPLRDAIILRLAPVDSAEDAALRRLRDRIADRIGMRMADHDSYEFHITLAYFVGQPTDAAYTELAAVLDDALTDMRSTLAPFDVGPGEYCLFNDMFCFQRQFFLA